MTNFIVSTRSVGSYRTGEKMWGVWNRTYKANGTQRGIIFIHGAGGDPDTAFLTGNKIYALAAAGYPVAVADLSAATYNNSNWANTDHLSAIDAAWSYAKTNFGFKTDKVGIAGSSMGACGGLSWARVNLSSVFAAGILVPVLDMDDIYQNNKGSLRSGIENAFGITYPTAIPSIGTRSPIAYGSTDLAGLPVCLWSSTNDSIASNTASCQAWDGRGSTKTVIDFGAHDHDASFADPQQYVQFFDSNGGRS